ncbi:MAG: hypothetical protein ABIJ01_03520 [Pseudomonadota bacterium]
MKMSKSVLPLYCALLVLLAGCVPMNPLVAHEYTDPNPHWKEEVALVDGGRIIVDRSQTYGRGGYLGEGRIIGRRTLDFTHPATGQKIHWEGDEHVIPMLLDFKDGTPYLAAKPFSCISFQKLGSPLPPYALYKYTGRSDQPFMRKPLEPPPKPKNGEYMSGEEMQASMREPAYQSPGWERITMAEFPEAFSKVNLVLDGYKMHKIMEEPAYKSAGYVTAELVRKYYSNYKPYTMVLRSGKKGAESCVADQEGEIGNMMDDVKPEDWEARLRKHHPDPAEYAYYQSILERLLKRHQEMEWVLDNVKPEELEAYMNRTYKDWWDRSDHYRTLIEIKQTRQAKERK